MASNIDEETVTPAAKRPRLEAEKNSTSSDIMAELPNPYLKELKNDFLYHIGYTREDCEKLFQDVKFVVAGGSANRMASFAELVAREIDYEKKTRDELNIAKTDRFAFYKIGPILSISHGMGVPSLTIMLHEMIKLLHYAGAKDAIIIRIGTSGGIGVDPGTVVITNKAFNAFLKEQHDTVILGGVVSRPTTIDQDIAQAILDCQNDDSFKTILGGTMCTDDFYEGQGRTDGGICEYTNEDKLQYLRRVNDAGISNIEMECTAMASLCLCNNVKCAVVCVALLDRLKGDQVDISPEVYKTWSLRPQQLVANFIKNRLGRST